MSNWDNNNSGWGGGAAAAADSWGAAASTGDSGWDAAPTTNGNDGAAAISGGVENINFDNGGNDSGGDRACYNCGQPGHNKADCQNERVERAFTGTCRTCSQEGHMAKDCPDAPPMQCKECESTEHLVKGCPNRVCKNCGETGHTISQCKNPRKIDRTSLKDLDTEEAWNAIKRVAETRDIDDIKEAIQTYIKVAPDATYADLEQAFRDQDIKLYLIAIPKELSTTFTNMDLQGNLGKKYTVTYRFQWAAPRPREREVWPKDPEENLERLKDAGEVVYGGLPKCRNCDQVGHIAKSCPEEKREVANSMEIVCFNCGEAGHRVRDCPTPRVDKFACKNCGKSGHRVAECTEPRSADDVECRKCGEMGHFSRDCPQGGSRGCRNCDQEGHIAKDCPEPRNVGKVQCRNCDEFGHTGKDCPKPRDMSRIKCGNCQEMGHYKSRCTNPFVPEDGGNGGDGGYGGGAAYGGSSNDGFETGAATGGGGGW